MKILIPAAAAAFLLLSPLSVTAQDASPAAPAPASVAPAPVAPAPAAAPAAPAAAPASAPVDNQLKAGELDALVAPIALYPDPLLSLVLMASTYPLEVVEAQRWLAANGKLKGASLKAAATKQGWDDSVSSLTATPSVLNLMSTQLQWTKKLGDAVIAQQADVMDAIQRLRSKAHANKKLDFDQTTERFGESVRRTGLHCDRAGRSQLDLCPVLRAGSCLWRLALSGLSTLLLCGARFHRGRLASSRHRIRRRLWHRLLGWWWLLVGRWLQLGQPAYLRQSPEQSEPARQSLGAPARPSARRKCFQ